MGPRHGRDLADLEALAGSLLALGRRVRDATLSAPPSPSDAAILRWEGGDHVYGVDARAHEVVLAGFETLDDRWAGQLVMEGIGEAVEVGEPGGPWTFLVDPIDGTRPWLAGKRSAWVLLGAGRDVRTLEDLEVGVAVEVPLSRARVGLSASAVVGAAVRATDDDLGPGRASVEVRLEPRQARELAGAYVTVARFAPGNKGRIGAWEDAVFGGVETYEDPYLCTGGQLMGLARGEDAAVLDPRPLFGASLSAHPYDLACLVLARAAGVIVEALPPGPLGYDLGLSTEVAWAGYANPSIAEQVRGRMETASGAEVWAGG